MADMQGGFAQDPNPEQTQSLGITLPNVQPDQQDTSLHITVRPNPAQDAKQIEERKLHDTLTAAIDARAAQYNTPKPNAFDSVSKALTQGATRDDARDYVASTTKVSPDTADANLVQGLQSKINTAMKAGYTEDQIRAHLGNVDKTLLDDAFKTAHVSPDYQKYDFNPNAQIKPAEDMMDLYSNLYSKYSTFGKSVLAPFSDSMSKSAAADKHLLAVTIVDKMKQKGLNVFLNGEGHIMYQNRSGGQPVELESSFLNGIWNSMYENIGTYTGITTGVRAGGQVGAEIGSMANPGAGTIIGGTAGALVGGIAGAYVGGATGRGLDNITNSLVLHENIDKQLLWSQMKDAGIGNAVMDVIGQGFIKVGVKGYRSIVKAYKYTTSGNTNGAFKALSEDLPISEAQAKALIQEFTRINGKAPPGATWKQQAISSAVATRQGGELYVAKAAATDPKLYQSVLTDLNARAKGLMTSIHALTDENVGSLMRSDLNAYRQDVKDFYEHVKQDGVAAIQGTDFRFDLEKLALKPVLADIEKSLGNPIMRERYLSYAMRIENASKDRTFGGLVELREAVNEFKYSKSLGHDDMKAINGVINRIDSQIATAAQEYMGKKDAARWLGNFNMAKAEYAKMKQLEENVLFNAITKDGTTEKGIQSAISKFSGNKDVDAETFNAVVSRLSNATRSKVEGAAIKNLTEKSKVTFGDATEQQAINFPLLSAQLKALNIETPQGKALVSAVDEFAKVFQNDKALYQITAGTPGMSVQNTLSSSIGGKVKMVIVGLLWKSGLTFLPGKAASNLALAHQVSKLFENPLHQNTVETLVKQVPPNLQTEVRSLVKQLQVETAQANTAKASEKPSDWLNMYKQAASGKMVSSDGALGKGIYLFDKIANPTPEMKVIKHEVNLSRMATLKDIQDVMGNQTDLETFVKMPKTIKQQTMDKLAEKGFLGVRVEGKAMLFPESTLKTLPKKGKKK